MVCYLRIPVVGAGLKYNIGSVGVVATVVLVVAVLDIEKIVGVAVDSTDAVRHMNTNLEKEASSCFLDSSKPVNCA